MNIKENKTWNLSRRPSTRPSSRGRELPNKRRHTRRPLAFKGSDLFAFTANTATDAAPELFSGEHILLYHPKEPQP